MKMTMPPVVIKGSMKELLSKAVSGSRIAMCRFELDNYGEPKDLKKWAVTPEGVLYLAHEGKGEPSTQIMSFLQNDGTRMMITDESEAEKAFDYLYHKEYPFLNDTYPPREYKHSAGFSFSRECISGENEIKTYEFFVRRNSTNVSLGTHTYQKRGWNEWGVAPDGNTVFFEEFNRYWKLNSDGSAIPVGTHEHDYYFPHCHRGSWVPGFNNDIYVQRTVGNRSKDSLYEYLVINSDNTETSLVETNVDVGRVQIHPLGLCILENSVLYLIIK